jgi:hypothetical protein
VLRQVLRPASEGNNALWVVEFYSDRSINEEEIGEKEIDRINTALSARVIAQFTNIIIDTYTLIPGAPFASL